MTIKAITEGAEIRAVEGVNKYNLYYTLQDLADIIADTDYSIGNVDLLIYDSVGLVATINASAIYYGTI